MDIERAKKALINADAAGDTEAAKAIANYIKTNQTQQPQPKQYSDSFLGNVAKDWDMRGQQLNEINKLYAQGQDPYSTAYQKATVYGSAPVDVLNNAASSLWGTVKEGAKKGENARIIPDLTFDVALPAIKSVGSAAYSLVPESFKQNAAQTAKQGVQEYQKFKTENPTLAGNLEATGRLANIALAMPQMSIAGRGLGEGLSMAGDVIEKSGQTAAKKARNKFVQDLVMPEEKTKQIIKDLSRGQRVQGKMLGLQTIPDERQLNMINEVSGIKGVSRLNTLTGNHNAILSESKKIGEQLDQALLSNNAPILGERLAKNLQNTKTELMQHLNMRGDAANYADDIILKANQIYSQEPKTVAGLLTARKKLDAWAKGELPTLFANPEKHGAAKDAYIAVRKAMNDLVAERADNVAVKDALQKQHILLSAGENLAPKAAKESDTLVGRTLQKVEKAVTLKSLIASGIAIGTGGATLGSAAIPLAVSGGALYVGGKALTAPQTRTFVGNVLKLSGKALGAKEKKALTDIANAAEAKVISDVLLLPSPENMSRLPMSDIEVLQKQKLMETYGKIPEPDTAPIFNQKPTPEQLPQKLLTGPKEMVGSVKSPPRPMTAEELQNAFDQRKRASSLGLSTDIYRVISKKEMREKMGPVWETITKDQKSQIEKQMSDMWKTKQVPLEQIIIKAKQNLRDLEVAKTGKYKQNAITEALLNAKRKGKNK